LWGQPRQAEEWVSQLLRRVAQGCAAVTITVALLALGGWATGRLILASLGHDFLPTPPGTALVFLLLCGALLVGCRHPAPRRARWLSCAGATLVLVVGLLVLAQYLTGTDLGFEHWLSRRAETFGQVPIGRMSPLAAGAFVVASLALLVLLGAPTRWRTAHDVAASAAAGVMAVGVLVLLGYWNRTAFVFGGGVIPMALPGAAAFVFLGAGLLAGARSPVLTWRGIASLAVGFGVGLAASVALFVLVSSQEQSRVRGEFDRKAEALALAFRGGVKGAVEELHNVGALFALSDSVDRRSFRTFVSQILERQPSIRTFAWNPLVADRERAGTEAAARREGFQEYRFTERYPDGRLGSAGRRPEYAPVLYVEPLAAREAALGFDALSDPVRRAALEKARDTGQAAATEPITPVTATPGDLGMLIFQPVYRPGAPTATMRQRRTALRGFAVETLRLETLIRGALPDPERDGLEFRLVDATGTLSEKTILASARAGAGARGPRRFATWVTVVDRQWRLELYAAPWYLAARRSEGPWLVLGSGLLITILLGAYLLASARHTAEVSRLAEGLRKISRAIDHSPASVVITDTQGAIEYVNPKFTQVTGYTFDEVRGQNPRVLKSGEMPEETYRKLWATITAGNEWRGELHNKKKNGELFWEAASISPVRSPDARITHYVGVKEDITEQKRMEAAARVHVHQLEALRATTADLTRELDLTRLLHLLITRAAELAGASSATVYLWEPAQATMVPAAWHGLGEWQATIRHVVGHGIAGTVAETRQGVLVNDYRTSRYANPVTLQHTTVTASLGEPLLYREELIGAITLNHEGGRSFTADDQTLLRLFADQAAIAIANARFFREERDRRAQLQAVRAVSAEIIQELDLAQVLRLVAQRACALTGAAAADIDLWDNDRQILVPNTSYGHAAPRPATARCLGEGVMGAVAASRHGLIINDYRSSPIAHPDTRAHTTITASLVEPLLYRDTLLGVIGVDHETPGRIFTPQDQDLLRLFAAQAAIAIENARLHEQIKDHAATLERQVQERTQDLEFALRLAEAASRAKSEFLTNMSHELRTPLNGILGFADLMLRQGQTLPREKQARFLANIHTSGQRLLELVSQLLDYTTAQGGGLGLERRPLSPAGALDEVLAEVRPLATKKGLALQVEIAYDLPCVHADSVRFRQICFNLLTNAVKFTPVGGTITVTARAVTGQLGDLAIGQLESDPNDPRAQLPSRPPAEWLELSVTDTGIGIRREDLPRLFQQFTQLESAYTKRHAGSGIGLALTRQLVELHGGRIWAESDGEGKGSTFRVVLPFGDSAEIRNTAAAVGDERPLHPAETGRTLEKVGDTNGGGQQSDRGTG
jgi:PAS domain S-box-containing protein